MMGEVTGNDVFISCKNLDERGVQTRDSEIAGDVYSFLTAKGLSVFLSNSTLEQLGASDYKSAIDTELESASILLAIGTSADHLNSPWVKYEWNTFANEILSNNKPNGKIFTYIDKMSVKDLPLALRQTQTFVHRKDPLESLYNFINNALALEGKKQLGKEPCTALERTTKEHPWVNSLGMKFAPVAGTRVLFSVWDTRVQDFEAFVADTNYDATGGMWSLDKGEWKQRGATWREHGFSQGPTHPVVGVNWHDAKKFCEWLTGREQGSGMLPRGRVYRLPTDAEWSAGVGLQDEEGTTPIEKHRKIERYPWGKNWPPLKGAGNYRGEESKIGEEPSDWEVIEGYNDGYPRTSPVGSFAANANGLYDMGGNVWQWCEDCYDAKEQSRVLRGASWGNNRPDRLLASFRLSDFPDYRVDRVGFRCVVAAESSR